jgi:uncharacterized protein (UPF0335 family)
MGKYSGNADERASSIRDRLIRLETDRRERVEDIKELMIEAKSAGLPKEEIAGIKLAAKRHFETMEKRVFRETAESFAAALGQLSDMPLGTAAIHHHATA